MRLKWKNDFLENFKACTVGKVVEEIYADEPEIAGAMGSAVTAFMKDKKLSLEEMGEAAVESWFIDRIEKEGFKKTATGLKLWGFVNCMVD